MNITLKPGAIAPFRATEGSAGYDLYAYLPDGLVTIAPGERKLIPTGVAIALPDGFEAQIRPRSGLALKHGITVLNSPGTIDSDYRGEIGVILVNHGDYSFEVRNGDRIAQMVLMAYGVLTDGWNVVDSLDDTERGEGGYGSTGAGDNR